MKKFDCKIFFGLQKLRKTEWLKIMRIVLFILIMSITQSFALGSYALNNSDAIFNFNQANQQRSVSGKVTDSSGSPLPGVTVVVKGTTQGTVTNADGDYTLTNFPEDATLVFSFVGMRTQEVVIGNQTSINITMEEESIGLEEVVAVGYGSMRKSDLTGSVASVSGDRLDKIATTMDLALQGRTPGVYITNTSAEPGGNARIRIRGSNSISGNNEPLIVLDGYPLTSEGEASNIVGGVQGMNPLLALNPNDIESIQILKDASATAIYGARGANGVILVTTKRGKERKTNVQFEASVGISNITNLPKMGTAQQFAEMWNEYDLSNGATPRYDGSSERRPLPENAGEGTNWIDLILRTGVRQNYQLGINGGDKKMKYNISGNYLLDEGIIKQSKMSKGNIRVNLDNNITDKVTISTTINITNTVTDRVQPGTAAGPRLQDPIILALRANPIIPASATGTGIFGGETFGDAEGNYFENPLALVTDKQDKKETEDYFTSVKGVYKFNEALSAVINTGMTRRYDQRNIYYPITTALGYQNNSMAYLNKYTSKNYLAEGYITYNKRFKRKHRINFMAGTSYQSNIRNTNNLRVSGFPDDILGIYGVQFATSTYTPSNDKTERVLASYYGRLNYDYLGRYTFTFTGRADGSSVFAENNKWGFFPSGALAWRISEEPFFPETDVISNLKLRTSFGVTGSQAIPPLGSLAQIRSANYTSGEHLISGTAITTVGNNRLRWEETEQINIGLDIAGFNNRIILTFDTYQKKTKKLLQTLQIPHSSGFSSSITNMGSLRNRGIEMDVFADVISKKNFSWNTGVNISANRSKVLDLGVNSFIYGTGPDGAPSWLRNIPITIIEVGQPATVFYGLKAIRLIQETDFDENGNPTFATYNEETRPGQWYYEDVNDDGVINSLDRQVIGNPEPKLIFGFNNELNYKNFQLSFLIQGVLGNDIMNLNKAYLSTGYVNLNKYADWYENRWTPENPTNDLNYTAIGTSQNNLSPGNYYIEDGSYLRLKNITLSYNFKDVIISLSGNNLLTITNYSGMDPEVGIFSDNLKPSVDFGSYPRSRSFHLSLRFNIN